MNPKLYLRAEREKCLTFANIYRDIHVLTVYLIEILFNSFANRADPDQAALVRAAWSGSSLFADRNDISDPSDTSGPDKKFLCSVYIIIHSGWSLA